MEIRDAINSQAEFHKEEWARLEVLRLQWKLSPEQHWNAILALHELTKERIFKLLNLHLYE